MIDTHAHVFVPEFRDDFAAVIQRAAAAGVQEIIMPSIRLDSILLMDGITDKTVKLHKTVGIHPCDVQDVLHPDLLADDLAKLASRTDVVAIGETGLDYFWSTDFVAQQKRSLSFHFDLAKAIDKPVILHNRNSTADLLKAVEQAQDGRLRGVWHCFTGTLDEGKRALDVGLLLGVGGVVTFKNGQVDQYISQLGLENLILETDSPYLAPVPHRGKRNEPAYISLVRDKLALLFGTSPEEITAKTTENARKLFRI